MSDTEIFTHVVEADGPAKGFTITGRRRLQPGASGVPLIVAIHGGTYTSKYFDVDGYSLLDQAEAKGLPVIAIDRPSYEGSTPVDEGAESIILENARVLEPVIGELWEQYGEGLTGVFIIGHSIGGAVTTAIAAAHPSWPLLGIALSGCLVRVPDGPREAFDQLPPITLIELPSPMKDSVMFGPEGTYEEGMPEASHISDTTVPRAELIDINNGWIARMKSVAAGVEVPVYARQAEFDHLWITDADQAVEFGEAFSSSPKVDAALWPNVGHCIDFHKTAAEFQQSQLDFALSVSA